MSDNDPKILDQLIHVARMCIAPFMRMLCRGGMHLVRDDALTKTPFGITKANCHWCGARLIMGRDGEWENVDG